MMETQKKKVSNAMNIGQEISKNDFYLLKENYQKVYGEEMSFSIPKHLIEKTLNLSSDVAGIRFMYGLRDLLNPNSRVLLLIPCSSILENTNSTESMLVEEGYYDHEGNVHLIQDVLLYMSQYVQHTSETHPDFIYKEITRGNFYGKNSLLSLMSGSCEYIEYNLGHNGEHISPIVNALDENFKEVNEVYMDFTTPCPNLCDENSDCAATLAVEKFATNAHELDDYRAFRDRLLLNLEGGAQLFEMYYLVSPVVAKILSRGENKDKTLEKFYNEEIVPFKLELEEGNYSRAVEALKQTLYKLFNEYEYSKVLS